MAKEKKQKQVKPPVRVITKPLNVLESPWMPEYVREEKTIWPLTAKVGLPENAPYIVELVAKEGVAPQSDAANTASQISTQASPQAFSAPSPDPAPQPEPASAASSPAPSVHPAPPVPAPSFEASTTAVPTPAPVLENAASPSFEPPLPAASPELASPGLSESTYLEVSPSGPEPAPSANISAPESPSYPDVSTPDYSAQENAGTPNSAHGESVSAPSLEVSETPVLQPPTQVPAHDTPAYGSPEQGTLREATPSQSEGTQSILERLRAKREAPDSAPKPSPSAPEVNGAPAPEAALQENVIQETATPAYESAPGAPEPSSNDISTIQVQTSSMLDERTSLDLSQELTRAEMERSQIFEPRFVHKNNGELPSGNVVVVGRAPSQADYAISDNPKVSSVHFKLSKEGSNWFVTDLGSTNGTKLNGLKIEANAPKQLKFGDSINFSGETITFEDGS